MVCHWVTSCAVAVLFPSSKDLLLLWETTGIKLSIIGDACAHCSLCSYLTWALALLFSILRKVHTDHTDHVRKPPQALPLNLQMFPPEDVCPSILTSLLKVGLPIIPLRMHIKGPPPAPWPSRPLGRGITTPRKRKRPGFQHSHSSNTNFCICITYSYCVTYFTHSLTSLHSLVCHLCVIFLGMGDCLAQLLLVLVHDHVPVPIVSWFSATDVWNLAPPPISMKPHPMKSKTARTWAPELFWGNQSRRDSGSSHQSWDGSLASVGTGMDLENSKQPDYGAPLLALRKGLGVLRDVPGILLWLNASSVTEPSTRCLSKNTWSRSSARGKVSTPPFTHRYYTYSVYSANRLAYPLP